MADEEDLQVTILPDEEANIAAAEPPVVKKVDTPAAEAKDPALTELSAQYEELKGKEAESTRRLQEAEQRRAAAEREAEASKKSATSSQYDTITTAINSSQQEVESAKRDLRSAKMAGDLENELEAIDRLSIARSTLTRLDEAKQDLEARAKAQPRRQEQPRQQDPVEAFAQGRTEKTASWIRAHPEFVTSDRGIRKLTAADAVAQAEDLIPDTAAYFARVEQYLGIGEAVEKAPIEAAQVATQPKAKSAAPPVAPGAQGGNGGNVPSVALTKGEALAATDGTHIWNWDDPSGEKKYKKGDPIGVKEFARLKLRGMKEGRYDRTYTDS